MPMGLIALLFSTVAATPPLHLVTELDFKDVSVYKPDGTLLVKDLNFSVKRGACEFCELNSFHVASSAYSCEFTNVGVR